MKYIFNETEVNFLFERSDDGIINVFLHGWGRSSGDFNSLIKSLDIKNYLLIDLPPFGKSEEPREWNIYSYSGMVLRILDKLKIEKINLIGHSFGGRIAIIIASMEAHRVEKVVLLDSAGMKPKTSLRKKMRILSYKLRKKMGLDVRKYGSHDFKNLTPNMKKTFLSIVNTFLEENAYLIKAKTLIIFGEKDKETPIYMAKRLNKLIKNSKLLIIKNAGHFCFLERGVFVSEKIKAFLEG